MKRRRDFPAEITLCGETWRIIFKRRIEDDGIECLGLCDSETKTIYIRLGQSPEERAATFLHEALHAIEFELERTIGHKIINLIEGPLAAMLLENFWLSPIKWTDVEEDDDLPEAG